MSVLDNVCKEAKRTEVVIYTDGLLDDLCAIEELSKYYSKATIVLVNADNLPICSYALADYNTSRFEEDCRGWFKQCNVLCEEQCKDGISIKEQVDVFLLCNAKAFMSNVNNLNIRKLHAMIGSSHEFNEDDQEWNASQCIESYKQLLEEIKMHPKWHQHTSKECEEFKRTNTVNPESLKYYKEYMDKMAVLNDNNCCYDLQCVYMAFTVRVKVSSQRVVSEDDIGVSFTKVSD